MSSYDKYFSEKNKTHMFNLMKDIIIRETAYDISKDHNYHNIFQTHYPQIFKDTQGDTIVDCNRNLIDTLCPTIIEDINRNMRKLPTIPEESPTSSSTISVINRDNPKSETIRKIHIYSSQRTPNSQNRHDFSVTIPETCTMHCSRITIPEEELPLFGLPTIMVKLATGTHVYTMLCELEDTKYLGDRNYISYIPDTRATIAIEADKELCIHIVDSSGEPCVHGIDIYECDGFKHIQTEDGDYTCVKVIDKRDTTQFQIKDTISLIQNETSQGSLTLLRIMGEYLLCKQDKKIHINGPFKILNISLQNHITFQSVPL